jgi:uncharacterized membrane protein (DUF373 family)
MQSTPPSLPDNAHPVEEAAARTRRSPGSPPTRESLAERSEAWLDAADRWLHLLQDALLVAVAAVLLVMGIFVVITAAGDLIGGVTLRLQGGGAIALHGDEGPSVVAVGENALLALILAELVATLLLSIRGRPLTVEPFIVIAVVAVVRHLLFLTVKTSDDHVIHTLEMLGMGGLVLLLVGALSLLKTMRTRDYKERSTEPGP